MATHDDCQELLLARERELDLLRKIISSIFSSPDYFVALERVLGEVVRATGWKFGEAWILSEDESALVNSRIYYTEEPSLSGFFEESLVYSFPYGVGLPGKALERREAVWFQDVSTNKEFLRAAIAARYGLKAGFSIPVFSGERVWGVLVFFAYEARRQEPGMIRLVSAVAAPLGEVIQRKELEYRLRQEQERSRQLETAKNFFFQNISHELRTPMNGILGLTQLLTDEIENPEQRELLGLITDSGNRLLHIFEKMLHLLQLNRPVSDEINTEGNILVVDPLIDEVVQRYRMSAIKKKLSFEFIMGASQAQITGNADFFRQAVDYLLENAFKFTCSGGIKVVTGLVGRGQKRRVYINVVDTGIGIAPAKQRLIFEDFRQADEGIDRPFEGIGLGLSLVKRIVDMMDGDIELQSEEGAGSSFTIFFPLVAGLHEYHGMLAPRQGGYRSDAEGEKRILLVEDNFINLLVIERHLEHDFAVTRASSGEKALEAAQKKRFDLVLMDINLGRGIDGIETTRQLRLMEPYQSTPIIAVTGYAMDKDRESLLGIGFNEYIAKPFSMEMLDTVITKVL